MASYVTDSLRILLLFYHFRVNGIRCSIAKTIITFDLIANQACYAFEHVTSLATVIFP